MGEWSPGSFDALPALQQRGSRTLVRWLHFPPHGTPERHWASSCPQSCPLEQGINFIFYVILFQCVWQYSQLLRSERSWRDPSHQSFPPHKTSRYKKIKDRDMDEYICPDPMRSQSIFGWNCFHKISWYHEQHASLWPGELLMEAPFSAAVLRPFGDHFLEAKHISWIN